MVTVGIVSEIVLHCTEGNSDKLYRLRIEEDATGTFSVHTENCRRGSAWVDQGYKVKGVALAAAEKSVASVVKTKEKGGYYLYSQNAPGVSSGAKPIAPVAKVAPTEPALRPQLLNPITEEELAPYLDDPNWGMEQKHDGERRPSRKEVDSISGYNKKGAPVSMDGEVAGALRTIGGDGVLDGELVGNRYHLFDCLEADGYDLRHKPYHFRRKSLELLLMGVTDDHLEIVPFVTDPQQKRDDLAWLRKMGAEGVVFKRMDAPYTPGRPNSGGDQVKFKFYETASVIVLAVNEKRSVMMGILTPPEGHPRAAAMPARFKPMTTGDKRPVRVNVGNVTIPPNQQIPEAGTVIEVRYLYAYPAGSIYQATYLGPRTDVDPDECLATQLKFRAGSEDDD